MDIEKVFIELESTAAGTDQDAFSPFVHSSGGRWQPTKATLSPKTTDAADATNHAVAKLYVNDGAAGSFAQLGATAGIVGTTAFTEGTNRDFVLAGEATVTDGACFKLEKTEGGTGGVGHWSVCVELRKIPAA